MVICSFHFLFHVSHGSFKSTARPVENGGHLGSFRAVWLTRWCGSSPSQDASNMKSSVFYSLGIYKMYFSLWILQHATWCQKTVYSYKLPKISAINIVFRPDHFPRHPMRSYYFLPWLYRLNLCWYYGRFPVCRPRDAGVRLVRCPFGTNGPQS